MQDLVLPDFRTSCHGSSMAEEINVLLRNFITKIIVQYAESECKQLVYLAGQPVDASFIKSVNLSSIPVLLGIVLTLVKTRATQGVFYPFEVSATYYPDAR